MSTAADNPVQHILALSGGKDSSALAVFIVRRKMLFKSFYLAAEGYKGTCGSKQMEQN